ncbi:17.7 kDa class II heat shock protein [Solanum dulcamara]|uniref:17.7 kDa class II heat shock protein n=1 Tax=Solanum dulcamara TaxID=45834 RepID=UPI0024850BFE|nr:17.7 kDa class II heat shock protein [Solanum dulcamara]
MESQVVRRRVNMIAAHLAAHDDISASATHLFPMSCSSSLNSAIPRYDNRMYYARQSSSSQACFMRLNSSEQGSCTESASPFKANDCAKKSTSASEGPMFSRPANKKIQYTAQDFKYNEIAKEAPKFARPRTRTNEASHFQLKERRNGLQSNGSEWSPKMDVAESGSMYVVSIELPGVNISDIKVEVSDKSLIVSGNRRTQCKVSAYLNGLVSAYHKKEIVQGPYRVFWPLPSNANKDRVSAEFVDGLLQITIPKL